MKPDFRQEYGTVSEPGSWRSQIRLAPKQAGMLTRLANGGKKSGVIAVAVEMLFVVMLGTPEEIEECAGVLAALLAFGDEGPRTLRHWSHGMRMLADMLNVEALKMVEAILEQETAK